MRKRKKETKPMGERNNIHHTQLRHPNTNALTNLFGIERKGEKENSMKEKTRMLGERERHGWGVSINTRFKSTSEQDNI